MCKYLTIGCPGVRGFSASLSDEISSASPNRSFAAGFLPTHTQTEFNRAAVCMTVCFIIHSIIYHSLCASGSESESESEAIFFFFLRVNSSSLSLPFIDSEIDDHKHKDLFK